ncbi:hypothetical protein O2W18_04430 [Modestobacter sp. VKM Ac-2983]|uniref:hypothetical protein n=1 Tax=Modestobacter sp. VKM Ac-2983 TaxID=3004137 RepID=UPI0022AB997F|nr:hypothetical protein [Modestobacter sp. VKM Ac-2983]MCZ2804340.1 hypothetical protein [Modestobacter sp. VKM Ac-2983]
MIQPVSSEQMPSLEVLEQVLARSQESYRFRAGSIDTKAGVTLGAVGVVIALVGVTPSIAGLVGQVFAISAGIMCVLALRPRKGAGVNPVSFRDAYLQADPLASRLAYLNAALAEWAGDEARLKEKDKQFEAAVVMLLLSVGTVIAGAFASLAAG